MTDTAPFQEIVYLTTRQVAWTATVTSGPSRERTLTYEMLYVLVGQ